MRRHLHVGRPIVYLSSSRSGATTMTGRSQPRGLRRRLTCGTCLWRQIGASADLCLSSVCTKTYTWAYTDDHWLLTFRLMSDEIRNRFRRLLPSDELDQETPSPLRRSHAAYLFCRNGACLGWGQGAFSKIIEVWPTGSEGFVGAPLALTRNAQSLHRRAVLMAGAAYRLG